MTILVAVDFSDVSRAILALVERSYAGGGHEVFVVHVAEPDPDFVGWEAGPETVRKQMATQFHRERNEVEAMALTLRDKGLNAHGLTVQGPTVATILDEIERREAELVIVGSHGHGAAYDLLVGSISSGVIRKASVPVLVVPDAARG